MFSQSITVQYIKASSTDICERSSFYFYFQCRYFWTFKEPKNRFQGINSAGLYSLAGRYDNFIPTQFLATIDCLKIPSLAFRYKNPIPNQFLAPLDCSKIPAQLTFLSYSIFLKTRFLIKVPLCFFRYFALAELTA